MKIISFFWIMTVTFFYLLTAAFLFFLFALKEIFGKLSIGR